jgi:hypothetical protein
MDLFLLARMGHAEGDELTVWQQAHEKLGILASIGVHDEACSTPPGPSGARGLGPAAQGKT